MTGEKAWKVWFEEDDEEEEDLGVLKTRILSMAGGSKTDQFDERYGFCFDVGSSSFFDL